ncbi:uncharacterized protein B0H18DRAFT_1125322 [Fomitopsis serialis]|uniref:uncharacterized protein n=1 Tax=Fomitopsis serialis TaxID=139415 RepID=UPI0020072088|nr:uncharacterized protein B0H18DRAFT_1125322 [Neoantrodia serialis]KAH9914739.1 hypothetical protein B0H18DRAFT_1125322 [Neoantrodia serialis]
MFATTRDWVFPKYDEEGWQVCFSGARRHKVLVSTPEKFMFRCQYNPKDPITGAGKLSSDCVSNELSDILLIAASVAFPPLHWHRDQTEYFDIIQGRVGYVLDGQEGYASAGDQVVIPSGAIHTFWCDPTSEKDLIMDITSKPGQGLDEAWINSTYGIMESHYRANIPVSFSQLMVMWDKASSVPGEYPRILGLAIVFFFGHIIGRLAGYKGSYPVYSGTPTVSRALGAKPGSHN